MHPKYFFFFSRNLISFASSLHVSLIFILISKNIRNWLTNSAEVLTWKKTNDTWNPAVETLEDTNPCRDCRERKREALKRKKILWWWVLSWPRKREKKKIKRSSAWSYIEDTSENYNLQSFKREIGCFVWGDGWGGGRGRGKGREQRLLLPAEPSSHLR